MSATQTTIGRRQAPSGFILVAVLWILAALATLATIYSVYVTNTANAFGIIGDRLQAEALVRAGLELTAHRLLAEGSGPPPSRGNFTFRLGRANVAIEFLSESGRIDLNVASKELLTGLFASLAVRRDLAEGFADRIIGWRTPPVAMDTEGSDYRTAGRRYPPRGGPFPHVEELSLVLGFAPELVERMLPFLTVYSGQGEINVLAAESQVIAALPGMTPDRLYAILAQRQLPRPDLAVIKAILGQSGTFATTDNSRSNRVNVRIQFDNGRQLTSEVVILLLDDGADPYRILSWRDDLDEYPAEIGRGAGLR
jgi:general secretion pathway protein K